MATNAFIGIVNLDGTVSSIYLHFDGYDEHAGAILRQHYADRELAKELIALGDLSILAPSLDCPVGHSFYTPQRGHCVAYHRDRGEPWFDVKTINCSFDEWVSDLRESRDYFYTFFRNKWHNKEEFEDALISA